MGRRGALGEGHWMASCFQEKAGGRKAKPQLGMNRNAKLRCLRLSNSIGLIGLRVVGETAKWDVHGNEKSKVGNESMWFPRTLAQGLLGKHETVEVYHSPPFI